jgi:acetoin utilization protein AcuB
MNLRNIMTSRVVTVEMDDRLGAVKAIFDSTRFHHLLVVDGDGRLLGVVSDRDLLKALSPYVGSPSETARDVATLNKRVHQIMSRKSVTMPPDTLITDAVKVLLEHRISCLPIIDGESRPIGIVTWRDLLRSFVS